MQIYHELQKVYENNLYDRTVLAAVYSLPENDVVIDIGIGISIFRKGDHVYDLYDYDDMIEIYGLTDDKKTLHSSCVW